MNKTINTFLFIFSFILIFLIPFSSAIVQQIADVDNVYVDSVVGGVCDSISNNFIGYTYYCISYIYNGVYGRECSYADTLDDQHNVSLPGYYNITIGYQDDGTGNCNATNTTACSNRICYKHDLTYGNFYPFEFDMFSVEAWDGSKITQDGNGITTFISVVGEGDGGALPYDDPVQNLSYPVLLRTLPNVYLDNGDSKSIDLTSYFSNYQSFTIMWYANYSGRTDEISIYPFRNIKKCWGDQLPSLIPFSFCVEQSGLSSILTLDSMNIMGETTIYVRARNGNYETMDYFYVYSSYFDAENDTYYYKENDTYWQESGTYVMNESSSYRDIVGYMVDRYSNIFPSANSMTTTRALTYSFMVMLIVGILIFVLAIGTRISGSIAFYLVIIVEIMLFLYFISISYIPKGVLIILILAGMVIAYFKVK